jgi:hypothetical protein
LIFRPGLKSETLVRIIFLHFGQGMSKESRLGISFSFHEGPAAMLFPSLRSSPLYRELFLKS